MGLGRATILKSIVLVAIASIASYQLIRVGQESARLLVNKVWVNRRLDAISRSADVTYGSEYLAYISLLRQQIPPDASVVDTRTFGLAQYDSPAFIQYFLFPRTIIPLTDAACQGEPDMNQCIIDLSGPQVYFIYGANFTISPAISRTFHVQTFNQAMGLLAPQSALVKP